MINLKGVWIRIFHRSWDRPTYRRVFGYLDQGVRPGEDDKSIAERQFERFNIGEDVTARQYFARGLRSLSVGDIVAIDDRYLRCEGEGWSPIAAPQ